MTYLGDFLRSGSVDFKFTTLATTGAASALTGGSVVVYKNNSTTTETSTGVTLTADFDGRTGLNHVGINLAADLSFYSAGANFEVVLATGTANSVSLNNYTLRSFSIENRNQAAGTTVATAVWQSLHTAAQLADSFGELLADNIDAAVSSRLAPSGTVAAAGTVTQPILVRGGTVAVATSAGTVTSPITVYAGTVDAATTIGNTGLVAIGTAIFDVAAGVETGLTFRQHNRLMRAVLFGVSDATDSSAGTIVFYRKDGSTAAGTAVYNAQGDRTSTSEGSL